MKTPAFSLLSNCIAASAGTGKTYRLVSRYIALLCLGARPDSLVALTYTNKAAGEFRNRILEALAQGALFVPNPQLPQEKQRNPLAVRVVETLFGNGSAETVPLLAGAPAGLLQQVGGFPEQSPELRDLLGHELNAAYFCDLLETLIRQLPFLQLSTLDSFFQKLVSRHCMELGLGDVRPLMGDDEKRARREALHAMIQLHDTNEENRRGFIDMCLSVTKGNPKGLEGKLAEYVKTYAALTERFPDEAAWSRFTDFGVDDVRDTPPLTADEWAELKAEYNAALDAVAADFKPRSHPDTATRGFLAKMESGNFGGMSRLEKYLEDDDFCGAGHERLRGLICRIRERCRRELLRATELKSLGVYRLLCTYAESYRKCVQSTGRMSFRDMTKEAQSLFEMQATEEESCRYEHWMLDEFQDTDRVQWNALRGLLDDVVTESELAGQCERGGRSYRSSARSLFVVGDRKQGIYGFRGTDDSLFAMLHQSAPAEQPGDELYQQALVPSSLTLSYRSVRSLMGRAETEGGQGGFINSLFAGMARDVAAQAAEAENGAPFAQEEAAELAEFCRHDTVCPTQGYVRVETLEKCATAEALREETLPQAIVRLLKQELTAEGGRALRPELTVAVLVRSNAEAKAVVQYIRRCLPHLPVQLVGDAEVAAASALGEVLLSFFLWLQHPSDAYRLGILRLSPLAGLTRAEGGDAAAAHAALLRALDERGYAALLQERLLPLFTDCRSARTFDEWFSAAVEFDTAGGSLAEWLDFMKQRSSRDAASSRAVQVMTMHKSKGLEFDAVIVPYIDDSSLDDTTDMSFFTTGESVMLSPGGADQRAAFPDSDWAQQAEAWKLRQRREAYNLMYVANTRAKYANYVILRSPATLKVLKKSPSRMELASGCAASVIARALLGGASFAEGTKEFELLLSPGILYEQGRADWYAEMLEDKRRKRAAAPSDAAPRSVAPAVLGHSDLRRRKLSPSKIETEQADNSPAVAVSEREGSAAPEPHADARSAADFGTAVHALFERIEWLEASPDSLFAGNGSPEAALVRAALQVPEIAALFRPQPQAAVLNEQPLDAVVRRDGEEIWVSGIIDRLVLERRFSAEETPHGVREHEEVTAAHIIDYKTNRRDAALSREQQDENLRAEYRGQMSAYRELVAAAFALPADRVSVTLVSVPSDGAPARTVQVF